MTEIEKQIREIESSRQVVKTASSVISTVSFAIPHETQRLIREILSDRRKEAFPTNPPSARKIESAN